MAWDSILVQALVAAVLTMLATGLGALPVLFTARLPASVIGSGYALAGGMMVSVSFFDLVLPGLETRRPWQLAAGFLAGACFFWLGDRYLEDKQWTVAGLQGAGGRRALLILGTMFVHSFPEGVAVGVGYASGKVGMGVFIAIAIGIHNIPEGLAISLPLAAEGVGFWRCFGYSVLSSLPQPIAVVPAVLLLSISRPLLPYGLGFAAGAMTYLVLAELLPESLEASGKHGTAWSFVAGFVCILLAQYAI
ncbi:MAG TPA: ZIP family metal transporter [Thermoanaerobaculia bacterium]|nr:ZIP family metal transporter [Thermoanaerobaculia bacterium]